MKITLIAAIGENNEIGQSNALLWDLPEDMKHFRERTKNKPVIMGRKTYESIGRLLPNRENIILTRNKDFFVEGARIENNIEKILQTLETEEVEEVMIIGGANIYQQALRLATNLSITFVDKVFPDADSFFPKFSLTGFSLTEEKKFLADHEHLHDFTICEFQKK